MDLFQPAVELGQWEMDWIVEKGSQKCFFSVLLFLNVIIKKSRQFYPGELNPSTCTSLPAHYNNLSNSKSAWFKSNPYKMLSYSKYF